VLYFVSRPTKAGALCSARKARHRAAITRLGDISVFHDLSIHGTPIPHSQEAESFQPFCPKAWPPAIAQAADAMRCESIRSAGG
jgi:hypothetical protein